MTLTTIQMTSSKNCITYANKCSSENERIVAKDKCEDKNFSPLFHQLLVAAGPIVLIINAGMISGFSAILLPQLEEPDSPIHVTTDEASWIASISALPMFCGCFLGGFFMEKYGRRSTHIIACVPCLVGWGLITLGTNVPMLLIGRFLTGICAGFLGAPTSVYLSETTTPRYRGFFLATQAFAVAAGILFSHLLGTFLSWQMTALITASLPSIAGILMCFTPESPSWWVKKGEVESASEAFYWCRGYSTEAKEELKVMLECQVEHKEQNKTVKEVIRDMLKPEFLKPLFIMNIVFLTSQLSGVNAIAFYSIDFIKDSVGEGLDVYVAMLIIDTIRVIMAAIACVLTRIFKRKPLLLISGFGVAISLLFISGFFFLSKFYPELGEYKSVTLVCLISYQIFVCIGLVPLSWTLIGELFPLSLRSYGTGISSAVCFILLFTVVKTVPTLFENFGITGTFFSYGVATLVGSVVLIFILPETKDKTLQDIEDYFKGLRRHL